MTAQVTIAGRELPLPVHDEHTIREIAVAVHKWNRLKVDTEFRVSRPEPTKNPKHRRNVRCVFLASQVKGVNANGIDLTDLGSPFDTAGQVAA